MTDNETPSPMRDRSQPNRDEVAQHTRLTIVDNALATSLLSDVRDARTGSAEFHRLAEALADLALWTACRELPLVAAMVPNHSGRPIEARTRAERVAGAVILRAGLLFAAPFRRLLGDSALYQIGVRRDERTLASTVYANNLPDQRGWADRVLILDPMLATGGTAVSALALLRDVFDGPVDVVTLLAAPIGVLAVLMADTDVRVVTVALDERLDERGYIEPGLGDAGDRLFGTLAR